ncbi:glycoside hydrolase family 32 protein [Paenibacillus caui]|uniref:glycoside hydrolase family 32 protein n=1 Tax=Paenibacillus caui TaxID=2873927 RepID=UPI001CA857F5
MSPITEKDKTPISNERYRLHYHLMPPAGWMNDPNGVSYYNGEYHVFYQHYPYAPFQGAMHWGHAKSRDLVHWEHLPVALAPSESYDKGGEGASGCWSGSAVDDQGTFVLVYTGHVDGNSPEEVQCIAFSSDGIVFEKLPENPVIPGPPDEECFGFRDPKVWKRGDTWYLVVGYGKDGLGKALLYSSSDLRSWHYHGPAAESDGTMGDMWECPDLFPLGRAEDDHVLIFSPMNMGITKTFYWTGKFDYTGLKFDLRHAERVDYGFDFYAPQTMVDARGRRIMYAWMNIWGADMPEREDGWMGSFTLPRELKLAEDGTLRFIPVEELKSLRGEHHSYTNVVIPEHGTLALPYLEGDSLEISAVIDVSGQADGTFGIRLRCSDDGAEYTEISYSHGEGKLQMDRNRAGAGNGGISEVELAPMEDGRVRLHLFLDTSSVELFMNEGRKTMTNRIYPASSSLGIHLFAQGAVSLESLDVWKLALHPAAKSGAISEK